VVASIESTGYRYDRTHCSVCYPVRLHQLAQNAHDVAVSYLCDHLNATETLFPGTALRVVYKLGSN
jgi:predicted adenine nucleotide alpha hydrolase (AANH) superfamily ATPase